MSGDTSIALELPTTDNNQLPRHTPSTDVNKLDNGYYRGSGSQPNLLQTAEREISEVRSMFIKLLSGGLIHIIGKAHCLLYMYYCSKLLAIGRKESIVWTASGT